MIESPHMSVGHYSISDSLCTTLCTLYWYLFLHRLLKPHDKPEPASRRYFEPKISFRQYSSPPLYHFLLAELRLIVFVFLLRQGTDFYMTSLDAQAVVSEWHNGINLVDILEVLLPQVITVISSRLPFHLRSKIAGLNISSSGSTSEVNSVESKEELDRCRLK